MASPINNSFYPNKSNCVSTIWKLFNLMSWFFSTPCKNAHVKNMLLLTLVWVQKLICVFFAINFIIAFTIHEKRSQIHQNVIVVFCVPPKLDKSVYLRKCPIAILISRQIRLPFWELHVAQKKSLNILTSLWKKNTFSKGEILIFYHCWAGTFVWFKENAGFEITDCVCR